MLPKMSKVHPMSHSEKTCEIFISHSAQDAEVVKILGSELEQLGLTVFASSRPADVPSGDWFEQIIQKLSEAQILVVLISVPSGNSMWVGFELGFFWDRKGRDSIFVLRHPKSNIPSPLDRLQAKSITDLEETLVFSRKLFSKLRPQDTFDASSLRMQNVVDKATEMQTKPPERSMANFTILLENAQWEEITSGDGYSTWICLDDVAFQIKQNHVRGDMTGIVTPNWLLRFPDISYIQYEVNLNIFGTTVQHLKFIAADGHRYFVPKPLTDFESNDMPVFYWIRDSLTLKVSKIISYFDSMLPNLESFADYCGIEIRSE